MGISRFLIVGAPRSGTKYISELLSSMGVQCSWENIYKGDQCNTWPTDHIGEASWFSLLYPDAIPNDVKILHQVRHPKFVCPSMKRWNLLGRKNSLDSRVIEGITATSYEMVTETSYVDSWYKMNLVAESMTDFRFDIVNIDFEIYRILEHIARIQTDSVEKCLNDILRDVNKQGGLSDKLRLEQSDMRSVRKHVECSEMVRRYFGEG